MSVSPEHDIAVIPARGGSKRIPRKNIAEFCGKSMIVHSIDNARKSGLFSKVVVSTEDEEIAAIARDAGADVPFARPPRLADDFATTLDVMRHAVNWCRHSCPKARRICCIYATAPFVRPGDLAAAQQRLLADPAAGVCIPVAEFVFPIQRALRLGPDESLSMINSDHHFTRSQDLETAWHDTGQFYYGTVDFWTRTERIFGENSVGLPVEHWRVQDIDTLDDWKRAELLFRQLHEI